MTLYELSQLSEKISGHLPRRDRRRKEAFGEFATLNLVGRKMTERTQEILIT